MGKMEMTAMLPRSTATPGPVEATSPVVASCCSAATFAPDVVRSWMRDRRVLAGAGLALGGSGIALGWDWLTAIGVAPLIVSAAPCLLMCALGLCMMGRGHQAGSVKPETAPEPGTPTDRNASS
jgi:hypothetical protein